MNTSSKPYLSGQSAEAKSVISPEAISDTARGAVEAVKNTMSDAADRGQHALSQASDAANEMMETASLQMKTFASELDAMAKRNPLGTIAGAVVVGILIGFLARGRA
jgi:ElaB/YqjD/DUF883 family membrane-anchored ribosome-binding protein